WQVVGVGDETDFFTVLALVRYIYLVGGIAADENDSEAGDAQALFAALLDLVGDFAPEIGVNLFAIDQLGFHDVPGEYIECGNCRMGRGLAIGQDAADSLLTQLFQINVNSSLTGE